LEPGADEWQLLLQIDSDETMATMPANLHRATAAALPTISVYAKIGGVAWI
jgi:hypothetical protein